MVELIVKVIVMIEEILVVTVEGLMEGIEMFVDPIEVVEMVEAIEVIEAPEALQALQVVEVVREDSDTIVLLVETAEGLEEVVGGVFDKVLLL